MENWINQREKQKKLEICKDLDRVWSVQWSARSKTSHEQLIDSASGPSDCLRLLIPNKIE